MSAIVATDLGKVYQRYNRPVDSLKEWVFRRQYHEKFWALRDASFRCESGEVMGVVGDNGAGKSTLLKLLAGTARQTEGELTIQGRVSAILELGSGFHVDFTGLENIHLGCAILGLNAAQVAEKVEEIIDFSEIGDFINQPVKSYSSGMFVRLAFSVVTSVDPDILVVDEALAVGDQHFQKKSMDRMMAFKDQGKSLVFCSHSLYQVKELCQKAIWLDQGKVKLYGSSADVIDAYTDHIRQKNKVAVYVTEQKKVQAEMLDPDRKSLEASLKEVELLGAEKNANDILEYKTHERFAIKILTEISPSLSVDDVHIGVVIKRNDGVECYGISTVLDGIKLFHQQDQVYGVVYEIEKLPLLSGNYVIDIWLIDSSSVHVYDSMFSSNGFAVRQESTEIGVTFIQHKWKDCS
ncbi:MAG: ABC transporter ATP-binding protein [Methylococcales bacterium]|nr:ABC transporter ATP-binding protein [Methylococcales bacterium]